MSRDLLSSLLEVLGVVCVLAAGFLFSWVAGLALVGVVLVLAGFVVDGEPEGEGDR